MSIYIIKEPGEPVKVFTDVTYSGQVDNWSVDAWVAKISGHGRLQWVHGGPPPPKSKRRRLW